jgi:hypothetical protein
MVDFFKLTVFLTFTFSRIQINRLLNNNKPTNTNINKLLTNHIIMK